jgi:hypothetical protein
MLLILFLVVPFQRCLLTSESYPFASQSPHPCPPLQHYDGFLSAPQSCAMDSTTRADIRFDKTLCPEKSQQHIDLYTSINRTQGEFFAVQSFASNSFIDFSSSLVECVSVFVGMVCNKVSPR